MSVFKRGNVWWYEFEFRNSRIRESSRSPSKDLAQRAERERRRSLELGANHLQAVKHVPTVSVAMAAYLEGNMHWSDNTRRINKAHAEHILPQLGRLLMNEVTPAHLSRYQAKRKADKASARTVNMEVSMVRQLMREHGFWAPLQGKVKMLRVREEVGRALTPDEMMRIEAAAKKTRSRSLPVALTLYRFTGMRLSELRLMKWRQVDLIEGFVIVGAGKTKAGEGRRIELAPTALRTLLEWRGNFPDAQPGHFIFPSERYGQNGEVYDIKPGKAIGSWKTAWTACRTAAKVKCRMHDFRHSFVSRLAENPEISDSTMMALTGHVSKRMLEHYTHSRVEAKRRAVESLEYPQKSPQ